MIYSNWIDKNGMIKPQEHWVDSGNGIYYTAMLFALKTMANEELDQLDRALWTKAVERCLTPDGKLLRTPDNQYGNESHDNILGLAVGCHLFNQTHAPKALINHLSKTNFVLNTDGNFEASDFMGRFPHIMLVLHEVAHPTSSPVILKWLSFAANKMSPTPDNTSGHHLTFMFQFLSLRLGAQVDVGSYNMVIKMLPKTTKEYFSPTHPIYRYAEISAERLF